MFLQLSGKKQNQSFSLSRYFFLWVCGSRVKTNPADSSTNGNHQGGSTIFHCLFQLNGENTYGTTHTCAKMSQREEAHLEVKQPSQLHKCEKTI